MKTRRTGYCPICDSNVVHARSFDNRLAWQLDRLMLGFAASFGIGPWRCVDCGNSQMLIRRSDNARREINENQEELAAPVGNFIRTRESLAHAASDGRYSEKYRAAVVQKILKCETTISRICEELGVSELEVQRWIKCWVESEMRQLRDATANPVHQSVISDFGQGSGEGHSGPATKHHDYKASGVVIEGRPVRKPG